MHGGVDGLELDAGAATFEADHAEALLCLGRNRDAQAAARRQHVHAQNLLALQALAAAARCRGLLADWDAFEHRFEAALALHDLLPGDFERARTQLCYGERLRRARRPRDSRAHLNAALSTFERLEAAPWVARAEEELRAGNSAPTRRGDPAARDQLTAQELRVAGMIAQGATVRETAAQLFLSMKTIEAHLGRTYRKLGVHNRAQLVIALSRDVQRPSGA